MTFSSSRENHDHQIKFWSNFLNVYNVYTDLQSSFQNQIVQNFTQMFRLHVTALRLLFYFHEHHPQKVTSHRDLILSLLLWKS